MENYKVMKETVIKYWSIHYFLNFKLVYLQSTFLCIRHFAKKGTN